MGGGGAQSIVEKVTLTLKDPEKLKKFVKRNKTYVIYRHRWCPVRR